MPEQFDLGENRVLGISHKVPGFMRQPPRIAGGGVAAKHTAADGEGRMLARIGGMVAEAQTFLAYVWKRAVRLGVLGALSVVVGVILVVFAHASIVDVLGACLIALGAACAISAFSGVRALRQGRAVLTAGSSRELEMVAYPIKSFRGGLTTVAVLATFDEAGATSRTPLAEVRSAWFTKRLGETPRAAARVFTTFEPGTPALAVGEHGAIIGTIKILRR